MLRNELRSGIAHVGQALRTPEDFALAWHNGTARYPWWVWGSLVATAILGTTTYTGAPASRAEELVMQIATCVEGLSEVAAWRDCAMHE